MHQHQQRPEANGPTGPSSYGLSQLRHSYVMQPTRLAHSVPPIFSSRLVIHILYCLSLLSHQSFSLVLGCRFSYPIFRHTSKLSKAVDVSQLSTDAVHRGKSCACITSYNNRYQRHHHGAPAADDSRGIDYYTCNFIRVSYTPTKALYSSTLTPEVKPLS